MNRQVENRKDLAVVTHSHGTPPLEVRIPTLAFPSTKISYEVAAPRIRGWLRRIMMTGETVGNHAITGSRRPTSETAVGPWDTVAKSVSVTLECLGTMVRQLKSFTMFFSYTALLG